MRAVFGLSDTPFPLEYDETLFYEEYLHTITDRNREILLYYYGNENNEQHTSKECSKKFDCTPECIRQILAKTIRQLRYPTRLIFLFCKPEDIRQSEYINKIQADIDKKRNEIAIINAKYGDVARQYKDINQTLADLHHLLSNYQDELKHACETGNVSNVPLSEIPVCDLGLSPRVYYKLSRRGYKTLQDITDVESMQDFMKLYNFGKRACEELQSTLNKFGIYIPEYPPKES